MNTPATAGAADTAHEALVEALREAAKALEGASGARVDLLTDYGRHLTDKWADAATAARAALALAEKGGGA